MILFIEIDLKLGTTSRVNEGLYSHTNLTKYFKITMHVFYDTYFTCLFHFMAYPNTQQYEKSLLIQNLQMPSCAVTAPLQTARCPSKCYSPTPIQSRSRDHIVTLTLYPHYVRAPRV